MLDLFPQEKVMRSKADIPAKLAKSYATFEDIPLK